MSWCFKRLGLVNRLVDLVGRSVQRFPDVLLDALHHLVVELRAPEGDEVHRCLEA